MSEMNDYVVKKLDTIDAKLDKFSEDLLKLRNESDRRFEKIEHNAEKFEIRLTNVEKFIDRPWKERIGTLFSESVIKGIGVIVSIMIMSIVISSFGGNVVDLLKSIFSALI